MTKVAILFNAPVRLVEITTRLEPYVEGLRSFGVEALTICRQGCEVGYPYAVRTFSDDREVADSHFWRGFDGVAVITWLRMTDILTAAREAGCRVVAFAESDGLASVRHHPWPTFEFMTRLQPTLRGKLGAAKFWLQRYLFRAGAEHRALIDNARAADAMTFAVRSGVETYSRLLTSLGAADLAGRVHWLPYPIPEEFCVGAVNPDRPDRVLAIGRWDSEQKNTPLLAAALRQLVQARPQTEVCLVGGGVEHFAALARKAPTVKLLGRLPREEVRQLMAASRVLLVSSRWESGPIVAWEMFAQGGTLVGTPILNMVGLTEGSRFGRVGRDHSARALADAAAAELRDWDAGVRSPEAIAAHWRPLVSPAAVAARLLELLGLK